MIARLLGWPGQVGIIFERKRFSKERYSNKNFRTFIRLIFRSNVLSKFSFFQKNGIRKKAKNEKNLKERILKQIFQFGKNVIRSNDLVPIKVKLENIDFPEVKFQIDFGGKIGFAN